MARQKPNYEEFQFKGASSSDAIEQIVKKREVRYVPTGYDDQHLAVYRTMPLSVRSPEPIVRLPAWSDDNGRPEGALFDAYLAEATGREVLAPNAPGVDFSDWRDAAHDATHRMTPDQLEQLRRHGSFQKVGHAVVRALVATMEQTEGRRELIIHGSSMGVALAGGVIRGALDEDMGVKGIVLAEGVNADQRSIPVLGGQFLTQFADAEGYIKQNPERLQDEGEPMTRWLRRTAEAVTANSAYVRGLARASFMHDIGDISGLSRQEQGVPVYITRGTASTLATEKGFEAMRQTFESAGVDTQTQEFKGHTHPYTMTVQSVLDVVDKIA